VNGFWEALAVRGGPCIDLLLPVRDFLVAFLQQERVCMAWCKASAQEEAYFRTIEGMETNSQKGNKFAEITEIWAGRALASIYIVYKLHAINKHIQYMNLSYCHAQPIVGNDESCDKQLVG